MVRIRMHDQGISGDSTKIPASQGSRASSDLTAHPSDLVEVNRVVGHSGLPVKVLYFQFPNLSQDEGVVHGVFTRHGGVSKSPYDTLNISYNTGDQPESVSANLEIIKQTIGTERLTFMNQLHGQDILILRQSDPSGFRTPASVDAIITNISDLAIMVKQADCQAVILFDPRTKTVSIVHCGWRGNVYNILGSVVGRMRSDFQCVPSDLKAAVGPSLGPCCAEFINHEKIFPEAFRRFMVREDYFSLWEISRWQLLESGLRKENIEVARLCTRCRTDLFFSYRANRVTGRFATVVMLK